jgi:hypothetical protein
MRHERSFLPPRTSASTSGTLEDSLTRQAIIAFSSAREPGQRTRSPQASVQENVTLAKQTGDNHLFRMCWPCVVRSRPVRRC